MIFIWIAIAFFGLLDILSIISIIQEHRKNKKDYARGLDVGYELSKRQFQPLQDRWEKLKEWLNSDISNGEYYWKVMSKIQELENVSDTNVGDKGEKV